MRNRIVNVAVALALGIALVACGSDSKTVETPDGNVAGDPTTVPADFPSEVPLPDGLELTSATTADKNGSKAFQFIYAVGEKSPSEAISDYQHQLESDDFTVTESRSFGTGAGSVASFAATKDNWTVVTSSVGGESTTNAILTLEVTTS